MPPYQGPWASPAAPYAAPSLGVTPPYRVRTSPHETEAPRWRISPTRVVPALRGTGGVRRAPGSRSAALSPRSPSPSVRSQRQLLRGHREGGQQGGAADLGRDDRHRRSRRGALTPLSHRWRGTRGVLRRRAVSAESSCTRAPGRRCLAATRAASTSLVPVAMHRLYPMSSSRPLRGRSAVVGVERAEHLVLADEVGQQGGMGEEHVPPLPSVVVCCHTVRPPTPLTPETKTRPGDGISVRPCVHQREAGGAEFNGSSASSVASSWRRPPAWCSRSAESAAVNGASGSALSSVARSARG